MREGTTTRRAAQPAPTWNGSDDDAAPATDVVFGLCGCGVAARARGTERRRLGDWPTALLLEELRRRDVLPRRNEAA